MKLDGLYAGKFTLAEQEIDTDIEAPAQGAGGGAEALNDTTGTRDAIDAQQPEEPIGPQTGYQSRGGYNVVMARDQLNGILKNWMEILGEFPAGSQEHEKLQMIGQRLVEISNTLTRDFIGEG